MADPRDIVERFVRAFYAGDAHTAREYLTDGLSFSGPSATFATADAYLRVLGHVAPGVKGVETRKVFVDGPDVCIVYDLLLDHPVGRSTIAELHHIEGDRIASIQMIFDSGPFVVRAGQQRGDTAVDPVCGMTVRKSAAAATRRHGSTTYYFCSPGCAVAFEKEPDAHLTSSR